MATVTEEYQLNCQIDADFIHQAEQDIYHILLAQRRQFNRRWQTNPSMNKLKVVLRHLGLLLCVVGALLVATSISLGMVWEQRVWMMWLALLLFLLLGWFFWRMPHFDQKTQAWTDRVSQKSCRKWAHKCVKQADAVVPFMAQYDIKGNQISYHRKRIDDAEQGDQWAFVWHRTLGGYAGMGQHATVLFKSVRAIQPKIIVLHEQADPFRAVLMALRIPVANEQPQSDA